MYGIILILVLVTMGGGIAYIGDKLGTKVGKKKLSIFGLRPKHTSIIVTIITGILITSSTLAILTLASENVRVALFGMERLNQQIKESETNLKQITAQLEQVNLEREETVAALTKAQADYQAVSRDLAKSKQQIAQLEDTKNRLEETKAALNQRVASLSDERAILEADIGKLNVLTQKLSEGIQFVREGDILYRSGEIIANAVLSYDDDHNKITSAMAAIVQQANQNILDRLNIKEPLEAIWISQGEFEEAIKVIDENDQDTIVRVVAAGNIIYGEPVRAHIELFANKLIYKENHLIYSEKFALGQQKDGTGEAEQIVLAFLKQVNITATKQGMIPDPLQGSVGVMNGAQFYDIVNKIESQSGFVQLTAYAADDTNAAGPLRLHIKVELLK